MKSQGLHRLGGRLLNLYREKGLSENQEWLWLCLISELEHRNRRITPCDRCTCLLCCSPFPDEIEDQVVRLDFV